MFTATPTRWAEVDVAAIEANTRVLKALTPGDCLLMGMVKANGYGHDMLVAARAAARGGAGWLGVSSITEALGLRDAGLAMPILNVGWTPHPDFALAAGADIDVTVFTADAVEAADAAARRTGRPLRVHWKLDSGMNRLGSPIALVTNVREALRRATHLTVAGLFTHFASADAATLESARAQHQRFLAWLDDVRPLFPDALVHSANSAALLRLPESHHDITRPGIALYGYAPPYCEGVVPLRPALTVKTLVTQVRRVPAGQSVGYGHTWTARADALVATLAAGYADGVDRRNSNNGSVLVGGVLCPIVGRVSMDQAAVDVSAVDGVEAGTEVTLMGPGGGGAVDASAVAGRIGTIANEVLCAVSARVPRIAVRTEA